MRYEAGASLATVAKEVGVDPQTLNSKRFGPVE